MSFSHPSGLLAGYISVLPEAGVPEIVHFGEQWAPRNFQIDSHRHNVWELYIQVDGETVWNVTGSDHLVQAGGFLAIPPGVLHHLALSRKPKHHFYFCAVDLESALSYLEIDPAVWACKDLILRQNAQALIPPFHALAREVTLGMAFRPMGIRTSLQHLLIEASRVVSAQPSPTSLLPTHRGVSLARELMDGDPTRHWRLSELAGRAHVSPSHLAERFRVEIGVTPKQYLLRARLERALDLLKDSDISITELALDLGYASSQHLANVVKARTGKTPRQIRAGESFTVSH